ENVTRVRRVNPDLVGATRDRTSGEPGMAPGGLQDLEVGDGGIPVGRHPPLAANLALGKKTDRLVDREALLGGNAPHDRLVALFDAALLEAFDEMAPCGIGCGAQHEPARLPIEPMNR